MLRLRWDVGAVKSLPPNVRMMCTENTPLLGRNGLEWFRCASSTSLRLQRAWADRHLGAGIPASHGKGESIAFPPAFRSVRLKLDHQDPVERAGRLVS
jgi:hypothetical protein